MASQNPDPAVLAEFVACATKFKNAAEAMKNYRIDNAANLGPAQSAALMHNITNTLIAASNASGAAINLQLQQVQGPLDTVGTATTDLKNAIDSLERTIATIQRALIFAQLIDDLAAAAVPFDPGKIVTAVDDADKALNPPAGN